MRDWIDRLLDRLLGSPVTPRAAAPLGVRARDVRLVAHTGVSHYALRPTTPQGVFEVSLLDPGTCTLEIAEGDQWYGVTDTYLIPSAPKRWYGELSTGNRLDV